MRFELIQRFSAPASTIARAYADPDLYPSLVGLPKLGGIEVLDHRSDGETARLRIRYAFTGDLPSAVTAVVDPRRLTWIQDTTHDLASGRSSFRLLPDHYPDRLSASGTTVVDVTERGTRRVVSGDLRVRALLVAHKVEQAIVSGLAEYLEAEAPTVDRWLEGDAPGGGATT